MRQRPKAEYSDEKKYQRRPTWTRRPEKNTREIEGVTWTLSLTGLVSRHRLVAALQPRLLPLNHVRPNMSAAATECSMIWRLSMQTNNERIMTSYRCPWVDGLVAWTHWTTSAINRSSLWHKTSLMSSEDDRSMLTDVRFKMPRLSYKRNRLRHLTDNVRLKMESTSHVLERFQFELPAQRAKVFVLHLIPPNFWEIVWEWLYLRGICLFVFVLSFGWHFLARHIDGDGQFHNWIRSG